MDIGATFFEFIKIPASAGAIFALFNRIGAWLDREIEPKLKEELRSYLKAGEWKPYYGNLLGLVSTLYDRVYGTKYVAWRPLLRACQLTLLPFGLLCLYWVATSTPVWLLISWETIVFGLLPRLLMSVAADFFNIAATRWSITLIKKRKASLISQIAIVLFDIIRVIVIAILLNLVALDLFRLLYVAFLTSSFSDSVSGSFLAISDPSHRSFLIQYITELLLFHEKEASFLFLPLFPSLLLCLFVVVSWIEHIGNYLSKPLNYFLSHLEYSSPFTFVFSLGGIIAGLLWISFLLILHGAYNYVL
jgi:hypothetical protein